MYSGLLQSKWHIKDIVKMFKAYRDGIRIKVGERLLSWSRNIKMSVTWRYFPCFSKDAASFPKGTYFKLLLFSGWGGIEWGQEVV